jgi:hypothetical protein
LLVPSVGYQENYGEAASGSDRPEAELDPGGAKQSFACSWHHERGQVWHTFSKAPLRRAPYIGSLSARIPIFCHQGGSKYEEGRNVRGMWGHVKCGNGLSRARLPSQIGSRDCAASPRRRCGRGHANGCVAALKVVGPSSGCGKPRVVPLAQPWSRSLGRTATLSLRAAAPTSLVLHCAPICRMTH